MSVLETPRIYFKGEISWDPIVTNNDPGHYDEDSGETILPPGTGRVKAFRDAAIKISQNHIWNPQGTHRVKFFNSSVCGYDKGAGTKPHDPFLNAAVDLTGMLVDLEPYGALSSQLFFDRMHFGVDGGYRISAPRSTRFTDRYVSFRRSSAPNTYIAGGASVVWQTSFPKEGGLKIDAFDSDALKSLSDGLNHADVLGLTVRFNSYRTIYYDNPNLSNRLQNAGPDEQALQAKLEAGGFQPNPARSLLVGVVGLWRKTDAAHEPGERTLVPVGKSRLGSSWVRMDGAGVTIDLSNCVPEVDAQLTKLNLHKLSLVTVDPTSHAVLQTLGSFDYDKYDRAAYEATAGIVTFPLTTPPAAPLPGVPAPNLQLQDSSNVPLLTEIPLRALPNTPNLYLEQGQNATITFQVYRQGQPVKQAGIPATIFQMDAGGQNVLGQTPVKTDSSGLLSLAITATSDGISAYVPSFSAVDDPTQTGINPAVNTYLYVRIRPADANIAALPATWNNVYTNVLANWNAMAPCMDNWLKLDDPVQVKAYAHVLKRLTDPANFEAFRFMPVTRDMSPGERTLLYKFLDGEQAQIETSSAEEREPSIFELSRATRGH